MEMVFRPYCDTDCRICTDIFDANCPEFFSPNERQAYEEFLEQASEGYEVCEVDGQVRGAFGLLDGGDDERRLNWILIDPRAQGIGIGLRMMERVIQLGRMSGARVVKIAASQKSAAFFARFGATTISFHEDGWGPGMDRVDMVLTL